MIAAERGQPRRRRAGWLVLLGCLLLPACSYVADEFGFLDRQAPQANGAAVGVPDPQAAQR